MNEISLPGKVRVSTDVLLQEIEGESVLLDLNSEFYFGLNKVGTRIWQLLSEETSVENVLTKLKGEYGVDEQLLAKDLSNILNALSENGLVEVLE